MEFCIQNTIKTLPYP